MTGKYKEEAGADRVWFAANVNTDPLRPDKVAQIDSVWAKVLQLEFSGGELREVELSLFVLQSVELSHVLDKVS